MTRHTSHIVPPVPENVTEAEMMAYRLWRSGIPLFVAAEEANIQALRLMQILNPKKQEAA